MNTGQLMQSLKLFSGSTAKSDDLASLLQLAKKYWINVNKLLSSSEEVWAMLLMNVLAQVTFSKLSNEVIAKFPDELQWAAKSAFKVSLSEVSSTHLNKK